MVKLNLNTKLKGKKKKPKKNTSPMEKNSGVVYKGAQLRLRYFEKDLGDTINLTF